MYSEFQDTVQLDSTGASGQSVTTTGDKLFWSPGAEPVRIRRIAAVITTAPTVTATVVDIEKRVTAGSDTGRVTDGIGQLNLPTTLLQGQVAYKDVNVLVKPGEEVVLKVGTASTAGAAHFLLFYEPSHELPANNANMVLST